MSAGSGSLGASQKGSRTRAAVRLGLEGILKTGGERRFEMVATFMGLEDASGVALRVHRRLVAGVFSSLVRLHGCTHGVGRVLDLTRVVVLPKKENVRGM